MRTRWPLLLSAAMLLAGCVGGLFTSKIAPPNPYLLSATPAAPGAAPEAPIAVDLTILKPRIRPGLETDRIAALYTDRRLEYYAGARWSGSLDDVLQDLTVQAFHLRANLRSVNSESSRFTNTYWLEIEVEEFQAEYTARGTAPLVRVHFIARLGSAADHSGIGSFEASATQQATEDRLGPIVSAYELAANAALDQVIAETVRILKARLGG